MFKIIRERKGSSNKKKKKKEVIQIEEMKDLGGKGSGSKLVVVAGKENKRLKVC